MNPMLYFVAGFIVGGITMGVLMPLLFLWRADKWEDEPSVRAVDDDMPTSGDPSSGGVGSGDE